MAKRKIITIDEARCTGCGQCIPNCPEGALQVIDGKARLVSDLFCDGLGACVGACPEDAMTVEEREAGQYDEARVMENIVRAGANTIAAHLAHLRQHGACDHYNQAVEYLRQHDISVPDIRQSSIDNRQLPCGCPGSQVRDLSPRSAISNLQSAVEPRPSRLRNWPIQLTLVPVSAPYLKDADLLIAADCVAAAHPGFHEDLVKGRVLLIGCPKLDDADPYLEKLAAMFRAAAPRSVTIAHMTVPCCSGLVQLVQRALAASGSNAELSEVTIDVDGSTVGKKHQRN